MSKLRHIIIIYSKLSLYAIPLNNRYGFQVQLSYYKLPSAPQPPAVLSRYQLHTELPLIGQIVSF